MAWQDGQAGASEIEITPAMVEAGAETIASYLDHGADFFHGLAAEVFKSMLSVAPTLSNPRLEVAARDRTG